MNDRYIHVDLSISHVNINDVALGLEQLKHAEAMFPTPDNPKGLIKLHTPRRKKNSFGSSQRH